MHVWIFLCICSICLVILCGCVKSKSFIKYAHPFSFTLFCSLLLLSQFSTCRDCLHLQHTWGIKEDEIHSFVGGVNKKKRASYSTALYLWRCEFLMKPEVVLTNSLISFWPTSVPRIRLVALIYFIKISKCIPPVYCCGVEEQSNQVYFAKTSNFQIDLKTLSSIFCWCNFSQVVAALTVLLPVHGRLCSLDNILIISLFPLLLSIQAWYKNFNDRQRNRNTVDQRDLVAVCIDALYFRSCMSALQQMHQVVWACVLFVGIF